VRSLFTLGGLTVLVLVIGMLAKQQLSTPLRTTVTTAAPGSDRSAQQPLVTQPADISRQVQQELNSAANEAAKRLEQLEGKP
jgi:hypothetical protein